MNRLIVLVAVALAVALAGCAQKEEPPPSNPVPDASKIFDKQGVPNKAGRGPTAN